MILSRSNPYFVGKHNAIDKHVSNFLMDVFQIAVAWLIAPLETFRELSRLDINGFGKIAWSVELVPITVSRKPTDRIDS